MFPNIDNNKMEQKVHITWTRVLLDDDSGDKPDDNDEGFWPSQDEEAAGYVLPENFDEEQRKAEERMSAWENGEWGFIGVIAKASIHIPIGGNSFRIMELQSGGLWGIESDAGDYLEEVYEEEKANLLAELKTLAAGLDEAIQKN